MDRKGSFVHLHVHSHYSLLDGAAKVEGLVKAAHQDGMPALALTDHGNLFGAVDFYDKATECGIKPIIGYEAYVAPGSRFEKSASGIKEASFHLTLLAHNDEGYRNLLKLASAAYLEGFYYRPRVDKELLSEHTDGLTCLSGCLGSEACHLILTERLEEATELLVQYRDMFGKENFFVEIQKSGSTDQTTANRGLVQLSRETGIPLIATNDIHYLRQDDAEAHEILLCINTGKTLSDENRMRFGSDQFYFKTTEEMAKEFEELPEAITNTVKVAEKCDVKIEFGKQHLPHFAPPNGLSSIEYLRQLCDEGLAKHYGKDNNLNEVWGRMDHELSVIDKTGFASYFLIVWDFIRHAREKSIRVGPGRGSVVGSFVAYLIGITDVDPLPHGLIFERFLTPDRVSPPDADIDFPDDRRDEIVEYVREKYGHDNIASIITFGTLGAKAVVRDIARVLDVPFADADSIAKKIPSSINIKLKDALEQEPALKELYERDETVRKIIDVGFKLEGLCRHASRHACGVVIADKPITEYAPLYKAGDNVTTEFDMNSVDKIGLLKVDFLGLSNLTVLEKALNRIEATTGERPDIDNLTFDDPKVWELFARGDTRGIFQFESPGMRELLQKLKPDCFEHLLQANAMYRPGPMASIPKFINGRHGREKPDYMHPLLEPILKETYGIMAFQEQVMRIANVMGGFSLAEADHLRKAMGKKKPEIMASYRQKFIEGAKKKKVDAKTATNVFDKMELFAGYGFNKSHACGYGVIAYQEGFLKCYYPTQYMAALMSVEIGNTDKIADYIEECKRMNIELLPPSISESEAEFTVEGDKIRFALVAIKNVGHRAIDSIVIERRRNGPFDSFFGLFERIDLHQVNKQAVSSMIKAGALDCLCKSRAQMIASIDDAIALGSSVQADRERGQGTLFGAFGAGDASARDQLAAEYEEWSENEMLAAEKEVLGMYLSSHPLAKHAETLRMFSTDTTRSLTDAEDGKEVVVGGIILQVSSRQIQNGRSKGQRMGKFMLEDIDGSIECVAFAKDWTNIEADVRPERLVFIRGRVAFRGSDPNLRVSEVIPIEGAFAKLTSELVLTLHSERVSEELISQIKDVLGNHLGACPVVFQVKTDDGRVVSIRIGHQYHVKPSTKLATSLHQLVGKEALTFRSKQDTLKGKR